MNHVKRFFDPKVLAKYKSYNFYLFLKKFILVNWCVVERVGVGRGGKWMGSYGEGMEWDEEYREMLSWSHPGLIINNEKKYENDS